jgi:hypothetical protein
LVSLIRTTSSILASSPTPVTLVSPTLTHDWPAPTPNTPVHIKEPLGFDEIYNNYDPIDCATVDVPVATVHIRLNRSSGNQLLVPASFKFSRWLLDPGYHPSRYRGYGKFFQQRICTPTQFNSQVPTLKAYLLCGF